MEQIESGAVGKNSRSNSRQSQKEFRSPSVFMAYAEQAAEAFAKYAINTSHENMHRVQGSDSPSIVG